MVREIHSDAKQQQFDYVKSKRKDQNFVMKFDKKVREGLVNMLSKGKTIREVLDEELEQIGGVIHKQECPLEKGLELEHYRNRIDGIYEKFYKSGKWIEGLKNVVLRPQVKGGVFTAINSELVAERNKACEPAEKIKKFIKVKKVRRVLKKGDNEQN